MSNILRLPALIDIHVHLRDPGETHKEDFYSGTRAALSGGVAAVFDMPTRSFHVLNEKELKIKINNAKKKAVCNWGLYFGTDGYNTDEFVKVYDKVVGLKIYLNSSTGHVLLTENSLENVLRKWISKKIIMVHTEDDNVDYLIKLALKFGRRIHITHINTANLLDKIIRAKEKTKNITCDVTPHHLFLTQNDLSKLAGFGMVKPILAATNDQEYLWKNIKHIDCIATDHAPHTIEEKKSDNPPTGIPGLETMLPLLLTAVNQGKISTEEIIRLTNTNPQKIFDYKQDEDTYIEADLDEEWIVKNEDLKTKCGWSPFDGWRVKGKLKKVFLRGTKVFEDGKILVSQGFGKNIR